MFLKSKAVWVIASVMLLSVMAIVMFAPSESGSKRTYVDKAANEAIRRAPEATLKQHGFGMPAGPLVEHEAEYEFTPEDVEFVDQVRERFARNMHVKHSQIKLIEQVINYLKAKYPDSWQGMVSAFLAELFPDMAEALVSKYEGLLAYNGWLETNRSDLRSMASADRRSALWAARYAAFGDDANQIWAMDIKNQQVRDALVFVNEAEGLSVNEKLSVYKESIEAAYGEQAEDFILSRQTELTGNFLSVESVQNQLHDMPAADRNAALRDIRLSLGMAPEAVDRWSGLDQKRDQKWQKGQEYMQERDRISREYQGEEREQEMAKLRNSSFEGEADTIKAEEDSGFYRYGNKRRIGRE